MAGTDDSRAEDLRRLLTDAVEVQLAALRAGISFWSEWIEQTTEFVQEATATLSRIASDDQEAKDVLLELVDAGRASVRGLTEIPRHTAARFIEELDRFEEAKATAAKSKAVAPKAPKPAPTKGTSRMAVKATKKAARPKRAGKVKA